jgi:NhaA family Na+:H+ antiporter
MFRPLPVGSVPGPIVRTSLRPGRTRLSHRPLTAAEHALSNPKKGIVSILQEFSIPLIAGVFAALLVANLGPEAHGWYEHWWGGGHGDVVPWSVPGMSVFGHRVTLHFLVNDVFMVFFFGIAAKEITESALPGGSLNPIRKALNPLISTVGGVLGPVAVFSGALYLTYKAGLFHDGVGYADLHRGWGIPTATDIALAWLVSRAVFGAGHPAVNFLLLLAVADDAIGLGIIAVFYGDPHHPTAPEWLLLAALGMAVAGTLRMLGVKKWTPYVFVGGPLAWAGLVMANLHPALALVMIVPFLPGPKQDTGMFVEEDEPGVPEPFHSPLHNFEHDTKLFVDMGLFFFAFANAGVVFSGIGPMTWIILGSLVFGKTIGITLFGLLASKLGMPLPDRMGLKELVMAGFVAALGLTVALFVSAAAFTDEILLGQAKMGALFSGFVGLAAILIGRMIGMRGKAEQHAEP